jgi:hypothetical protein
MFFGPILKKEIDTQKFLALPEAQFLVPIMVAINDFLLHDTIVSGVQTSLTIHRRDNDLDENQMVIMEAQLELLNRHQFGLIWECLELLKDLENKAPTIVDFLNSFPELKNIYDLVKPSCKSEKLRRIRNNLSFHFGLDHMKEALKSVQGQPTMVLKTEIGDNYWYEIASESQAHLLTRTITKIVKDQSTLQEATTKAGEEGLDNRVIKLNLLSIFLSITEHYLQDCYLPN